ncbi:MAG TPA: hypothetical protein VFS00_29455 [Polyangiaceae bacterium]|nr:hypothetical protein [Polyangiaceae bacterium]
MPMKAASLWSSPACVALLAGLGLLSLSAGAAASPAYPPLVKGYFDLDKAPACTLCHQSEAGGYATLNASVGKYLGTTLGLPPKLAEADLNRYLEQWGDRQDCDDDDAFDLAELKAGTDPTDPDDKPAGASGAGGSPGAAGAKGAPKGAGDAGVVAGAGDDDSGEALQGPGTQATCAVAVAPGAAKAGAEGVGFALGLAALLSRRRRTASR